MAAGPVTIWFRDGANVPFKKQMWSDDGTVTGVLTEIATSGAGGGSSGFTGSLSFTPSASAYGAGDIIGVAQQMALTYTDGSPVAPGSLIRILTSILRIDQTALQASEGAYSLEGYSTTPPSAQADNDQWTLASADLAPYRGNIPLGTPVDLGAACYVKSAGIDLDIKLATGSSSLWFELKTAAACTPGAVARQAVLYGIVL